MFHNTTVTRRDNPNLRLCDLNPGDLAVVCHEPQAAYLILDTDECVRLHRIHCQTGLVPGWKQDRTPVTLLRPGDSVTLTVK